MSWYIKRSDKQRCMKIKVLKDQAKDVMDQFDLRKFLNKEMFIPCMDILSNVSQFYNFFKK